MVYQWFLSFCNIQIYFKDFSKLPIVPGPLASVLQIPYSKTLQIRLRTTVLNPKTAFIIITIDSA